jgi:hypothetical protein
MSRTSIWAIFLFASFTVVSNGTFTDSIAFIISVASTVVVTVVDATSLVAFLAYETFVAYAFTFLFVHTISGVRYRHSSAYTVNTTLACF